MKNNVNLMSVTVNKYPGILTRAILRKFNARHKKSRKTGQNGAGQRSKVCAAADSFKIARYRFFYWRKFNERIRNAV
ncbi:hypothetical protein M1E08_12305 [Erwinia sp. PK3-005]